MFPWAPVSNLALSAAGRLLMLCRSTFTVTNTSFAGWGWGPITSTVIDSDVIVSNWSLSSLLFPSLRFPLADLRLLRRSLLLEWWRDLGFSLFLCLPRVPPWFLERQTLAQWFSFWQFRHTDPYAGRFFLGCKGWSIPQLGHFFALFSLSFSLIPWISLLLSPSNSSICDWHIFAGFVLSSASVQVQLLYVSKPCLPIHNKTRRLAACTQAVVILRSTSYIAVELNVLHFNTPVIWEHSRNVENTRLRVVFSTFPSWSQMPVVFYRSVIHDLGFFIC